MRFGNLTSKYRRRGGGPGIRSDKTKALFGASLFCVSLLLLSVGIDPVQRAF